MQLIILSGASSDIAKAYFNELHNELTDAIIVTLSRSDFDNSFNRTTQHNVCHQHFITDYSDASLAAVATELARYDTPLSQLMIFNGMLHNSDHAPERKLSDISQAHFIDSMKTNALLPIACVNAFVPLLNRKTPSVICALSARVGSVSDNKLGGWYSYRASKAALNMLFKSAAIEIKRRFQHNHCVLFHPGTTDTPLSKPFQANVPADKLFTPEFVAKQLYKFVADTHFLSQLDNPAYIDWQGKTIDW
ncbi:SDR family NAD(P)-dependent oxidoreductase [Pseudoalteromonas lipolytica]